MGVPRIERPCVTSFSVLSQQNTYHASCILGEGVSQSNFVVRDKKNFSTRWNTGTNIIPPYHTKIAHLKTHPHMFDAENISYNLCKISHLLQIKYKGLILWKQ